MAGQIQYQGESIELLGWGNPFSGYYLHQFDPGGKVDGTFQAPRLPEGTMAALWQGQVLDLTFVGSEDRTRDLFDKAMRPGVYRYSFGPFGDDPDGCCGPSGFLEITEVTDETATVEIMNTTRGPAFNQAVIEATTIPRDGNIARFERSGDIASDCAFDVEVFSDFASVSYVDDRYDCGFGFSAGVNGLYLVVNDAEN